MDSNPSTSDAAAHAGEPWLEEPLAAFERAWWGGAAPPLAEFLPAELPDQRRRVVALELVKLDLHFRQAARSPGAARLMPLERYVERLPILGSLAGLPADLIAEEYLAFCQAGQQPSVEDYLARFPAQGAELRDLLPRVLADWRREGDAFPAPPPLSPTPRSRFLLRRLLGSGGLARVYAALDTTTNKPVAVKLLKKSLWTNPAARERMQAEAEILRVLDVPGVVRYRDYGELDRAGPFLATELILGRDLEQAFRETRPADAQIIAIAEQLRTILTEIHERGVIHADLKPSNVILGDDGNITLVDFGFAVRRDDQTRSWPVPRGGTPAFLAPELRDSVTTVIDPRIDVYGFGAVVNWLLAGSQAAELDALQRLCQACFTADVFLRPHSIPAL